MRELDIGLVAILVVGATLLLTVFRELAPAGGLSGRGRWLLSLGLGLGVLAFVFKLGLVLLMTLGPPEVLRTLAAWGPVRPHLSPPEADPLAPTASHYVWQALPRVAPAPADNPTTPAKVVLGRMLFEDPRLSADGQVACASCHDVAHGAGADGRRRALGTGGQRGGRNAPTVWNAAFLAPLFWDGRAGSLEAQAAGPLLNPVEMGLPTAAAVEARVRAQPRYRQAFAAAFGDQGEASMARITAAIAAYERTLVTPDTPYDRYVRGEPGALTPEQVRGMLLFESLGCVQCHSGPAFSQAGVGEAGAPLRAFPAFDTPLARRWQGAADAGLAPAGAARGVWRVPSLRNVALTAPYFHDGSVDTLEEAVRTMAAGQLGLAVDGLAPAAPVEARAQGEPGLRLQARQRLDADGLRAVVAFLRSLSDPALADAWRPPAQP